MKYLFWICLLSPFYFQAQHTETERCLTLYEKYRKEKKYDSVVIVCKQLMQQDRKISKEYHLDYALANAAFKSGNYELAVKQSKKFLPNFYIPAQAHRNRQCFQKNMHCKTLCSQLADYYAQTGNLSKEYHYLSLMFHKFNSAPCGTGRQVWRNTVYQRMIDCSNRMGRTKRAERLEKRLEKHTK